MTVRLIIALVLGLAALSAQGHSLGLSLLRLEAQSPGIYSVRWQPSESLAGRLAIDRIQYPAGCSMVDSLLRCDSGALNGEIHLQGWPSHANAVLVHVPLAGEASHRMFDRGRIQIGGDASAGGHNELGTLRDYLVIGVEHIVLGIDHLLFVLGLVLVVGFNRGLVWTITAFTLSHSLTLAFSVLGWLTLPPGPVEVVIAASIVLVAREALAKRMTLTHRWPWLLAFVFGLIHGLGFAGALADIGLPPGRELLALLAFNLGVEVGQLLVIAVFFAAARLASRFIPQRIPIATTGLCYGVGIMATFWTLERSLGLIT